MTQFINCLFVHQKSLQDPQHARNGCSQYAPEWELLTNVAACPQMSADTEDGGENDLSKCQDLFEG